MISVRNVTCRYAGHVSCAIRCLTCEVSSSGITAVVGRSGVGKSTLLALLAGLYLRNDSVIAELSGEIILDGRNPKALRGAGLISWVPQTPALLDHLTVMQNILLAVAIQEGDSPKRSAQKYEDRVKSILVRYGLAADCAYRRPKELSGGMATRVSLIRASITSPRYLFLDEPFASLDLVNRWCIYRLIQQERGAANVSTILTTHDVPEALLVANRVLVVQDTAAGTVMREIENEPFDIGETLDGRTLSAVRKRAESIEQQLFS